MKAIMIKQYDFKYRVNWKLKNYPKILLKGLFHLLFVSPRIKRQIEPGKLVEIEKHHPIESSII